MALENRLETKRIVIHHSVSLPNTTMEQIDQWHRARGFAMIGYHYFIEQDGTVKIGRPDWAVGAHAFGANGDSLGVCQAGNFDEAPPTALQMESLAGLIKGSIRRLYGNMPYIGHNEVDPVNHPTACPGALFPWYDLEKRLEGNAKISDVNEALKLLALRGVCDKEHWTEAVKWYPYVDQLILNMANELMKEAL